jgi:hypothetical protein
MVVKAPHDFLLACSEHMCIGLHLSKPYPKNYQPEAARACLREIESHGYENLTPEQWAEYQRIPRQLEAWLNDHCEPVMMKVVPDVLPVQ